MCLKVFEEKGLTRWQAMEDPLWALIRMQESMFQGLSWP